MTNFSRGAALRTGVAFAALGGAALITACGSGTSGSNATPGNVSTGATSTSAAPSPSSPSSAKTQLPASSPATPAPTSTSTTVKVSAATCKRVSSLRTSLTSLTHVKLSASSAGQITTDLKNIQTQVAALKNAPGFQAHAQQLNSSLNQVKKAAHGIGTSPSPGQVGSIISALSGLKSQSSATMSELNSLCPQK